MEIKQNFLINNECYKAGGTIKVTKLMVHSTACPNVSAAGFAKAWNTPDRKSTRLNSSHRL